MSDQTGRARSVLSVGLQGANVIATAGVIITVLTLWGNFRSEGTTLKMLVDQAQSDVEQASVDIRELTKTVSTIDKLVSLVERNRTDIDKLQGLILDLTRITIDMSSTNTQRGLELDSLQHRVLTLEREIKQ